MPFFLFSKGRPELTPVAIQAGTLLARRIFGGSKKTMVKLNFCGWPPFFIRLVHFLCCVSSNLSFCVYVNVCVCVCHCVCVRVGEK